jgi:glycosyltransferase involved in cell wall biosynthesis
MPMGYALVLTHHGIEVQDAVQGRLCRWSRSFPDELIVVAQWMRDALGTPQAHVIPCGVDLSLFHPMPRAEARQVLGLDAGRRYVLFAGEWWRPENASIWSRRRWSGCSAGIRTSSC